MLFGLAASLVACFPDAPAKDDAAGADTAELAETVVVDTIRDDGNLDAADATVDDEVDVAAVGCSGGCGHLDGPCVVGECVDGRCEGRPLSSGTCDDGDACTTGDTCRAGVCAGEAVVCSASSQCHEVGVCDPTSGECSDPEKAFDAPCDSGTEYPGFCRSGSCKPRMVAIGGMGTCLVVDGDLRCWNESGVPAKDQIHLHFDRDVVEVAVGNADICVRFADDTVRCWGSGAVSASSNPEGADDLGIGDVKVVRAGGSYACVVSRAEGRVRCWGDAGSQTLLGPGVAGPISYTAAPDVPPLPIAKPVVALATTSTHACAINVDGAVVCWGSEAKGALGYGDGRDRGSQTTDFAEFVPVGLELVGITCGARFSCGLTAGGAVRCWGGLLSYGIDRVYGDDETASRAGFVQLGGPVAALSTPQSGKNDTCVVRTNGAVLCWGQYVPPVGGIPTTAYSPTLGYESTADIGDDETPVEAGTVDVGEPVAQISASAFNLVSATCAIGVSGRLHCWGYPPLAGYGDGNRRGDLPDTMPPGDVPFE